MVKPENDPVQPKTIWRYDPHLDPALQFDPSRAKIEKLIDNTLKSRDETKMRAALEELKRLQQPYLNWTGKAERTSFEIDTVSLHVHERIDPASILSSVRKQVDKGKKTGEWLQPDLFAAPFENLPLRDAIDFYRHERGWANRLVAGDALLVMNSLIQKESMAGQVQMVYIDPPYGIKYGSNFQPFLNKRDVKDRKDEDLTQEPETIKAFRDTWELGIHSYLSYLRDRFLVAKDLLHESGTIFLQIGDENLHLARCILEEVFGPDNFIAIITVQKTSSATSELLPGTTDFLLLYAKNRRAVKFRPLFKEKTLDGEGASAYDKVELPNGKRIQAGQGAEAQARPFRYSDMRSSRPPGSFPVEFNGVTVSPKVGYWKTGEEGFRRLMQANRLDLAGNSLNYVRYLADFPAFPLNNIWSDLSSSVGGEKVYVVQTSHKIAERCLLMTTDPGDLVLDPTCGSGTTRSGEGAG